MVHGTHLDRTHLTHFNEIRGCSPWVWFTESIASMITMVVSLFDWKGYFYAQSKLNVSTFPVIQMFRWHHDTKTKIDWSELSLVAHSYVILYDENIINTNWVSIISMISIGMFIIHMCTKIHISFIRWKLEFKSDFCFNIQCAKSKLLVN